MMQSNGTSYGVGYPQQHTYGNGTPESSLRRRNLDHVVQQQQQQPHHPSRSVVKQLDFLFPKVEAEYTVQTEKGGWTSIIAYILIAILALAETVAWASSNSRTTHEHITVDTSMGRRMRVNLDIVFPAVACDDLHIDIIDVAGDSQLDVEDTITKKRLNRRGDPMGNEETAQVNKHKTQQEQKDRLSKEPLPENYCGSCFGAQAEEEQCCNTCDELIDAYKAKRWRTDLVILSAEQCIREGRDKVDGVRLLKRGEGCHMQGYFMMNRVGGNFHMAMGEGIERDGRHIHSFNPDDVHHFNSSHIINHLSFGLEVPDLDKNGEQTPLNGVAKLVGKEHGTTGLFQYFIKIVPTTYMGAGKGGRNVETNRFFYTERFRPLMKEYFEGETDDDDDLGMNNSTMFDQQQPRKLDEDGDKAVVHAGHGGRHGHHHHHNVKKNSILPGVFFIYEIYPFEVEISPLSVPFTHLLIRLMATVGGVLTIARWADSFLYSRDRRRNGGGFGLGGV